MEQEKQSFVDQKNNINQTLEKYKNQLKEFEDSIKETEVNFINYIIIKLINI